MCRISILSMCDGKPTEFRPFNHIGTDTQTNPNIISVVWKRMKSYCDVTSTLSKHVTVVSRIIYVQYKPTEFRPLVIAIFLMVDESLARKNDD